MSLETCETCGRPKAACVCDRIVQLPTTKRVLILQHPQEQDAVLGSAQILVASLPKAQIVVGLSWRNLKAALGEEDIDVRKWAVLFPAKESDRARSVEPTELDGIVVLDGTWSKAKTLWWRNPWLTKLPRLKLPPMEPSIYGSLRAEPKREYVSTLESVAAALTVCGEPKETEIALRRVFRTMVQRVRDARIIPPRRRPRKPQTGRAR